MKTTVRSTVTVTCSSRQWEEIRGGPLSSITQKSIQVDGHGAAVATDLLQSLDDITNNNSSVAAAARRRESSRESNRKKKEEEEEEIRLKEMLRLSITIVVSYTKSSSSHLYRLCRLPPPPFFIVVSSQ